MTTDVFMYLLLVKSDPLPAQQYFLPVITYLFSN